MNKKTKVWLIVAAFLVVIGLIISAAAMTGIGWKFSQLGTGKYETNTHEINETFRNISIRTDTADISFVLSKDDKCKVVCCELENSKHSVCVQDGTLSVIEVDEREWHEYISITTDTPKITVYLPEGAYGMLSITESTGDIQIPKDFTFVSVDISASTGDITVSASASELIKITTSTGDIGIDHISAGAVDLTVSTGRVTASDVICDGDMKIGVSTGKANLTDITCKSMFSNGSTGDISFKNVIATEQFSIERSTGDVNFDVCDAAEVFVKTDTGVVSGSLLSEKVFIAQTDTGSIDVPKTTTGGKCEIITNTGDIKITLG